MAAVKPAATRPPAAPPLPHRNLPLLLLQAREAVLAQFRPILQAHRLTEQQWRILRTLVEQGPLEPREIVQRCGISSPSLAGVLARMAGQRLVTRRPLASDRRRQVVAAGSVGRRLAARMAPQIESAYQALEARLGPPFVARIYADMDRLIQTLGRE